MPLVLDIGRVNRVTPINSSIPFVIGNGVTVVHPRRLTGSKVINAAEANFRINVLVKQVVHLQIFALIATRDGVVARGVGTANHNLLDLPVEGIGLTAVVLT